MTRNRLAGLAWTLCALTVALAVAGPIIAIRVAGTTANLPQLGLVMVNGLAAVEFSLMGSLIVSRQPRNTIGWLLLVVGPSFAASVTVLDSWARALPDPVILTPLNILLLWFSGWSWWLLVGPLLLIPLVFPDGRLLSPRWRWVVALLAGSFAIFLIGATFTATATLSDGTRTVANPIGFLPDSVTQILFGAFPFPLLAAALGSGAALFVRYRRAGAVERQQIKWFLYAGALFVVAFIIQFVVPSGSDNAITFPGVLFIGAILFVPVSIGVAILRYRLWDIDVVIRRTLVYALLTGLLALAYFGSVLALQAIFSALTGETQSALVTVLSTLVIAALFVPLRRRVQGAIDRRLYRRKYDSARTLAAFGATLRDETNLDQLTAHLTDVVDETMQPLSVGLWLPTERDRSSGPGRPR